MNYDVIENTKKREIRTKIKNWKTILLGSGKHNDVTY